MIEVAHWKRWATSILEGFVTVYLGSLGRMIPIYSTPSAQLETEERYTFTRTLEGRRKAQPKPIGRRTWGLNAQFADPSEHSLLSQFADGVWGAGPFVFVSADAPHTNLLTPGAASCDPALITATSFVSNGGPAEVEPGVWVGRSYLNTSSSINMAFPARTPVIPGRQVTGSAYVRGAGMKVNVSFWDAADQFISSAGSSGSGSASSWSRLSVTRTPPVNAVRVAVYATGAGRGAAPAVTWSEGVLPWSDGQGCEKAVVSSMSRDQVLAVAGHTYSNVSFTVSEVG